MMFPAALHALIDRLRIKDRKLRYHAAILEAAIYNVNRDPDRRPEPFTADDFMPDESGRAGEMDDMKEFVLQIERGELEEPDPAEVNAFKERLLGNFNIKREIVRKPIRA